LGLGFFQQREYEEVEKAMPNFEAGELPDQILLHEFAHEWWGNSVSCTDNAELWIHEAFATYAEAIFIEEQYGYGHALDYINAMKPSVKNQHPLIGKFGVNHIHYDIWDMYSKGALFLNTLRHVIDNDSLWFSILKGIPKDFKHQSITTGEVLEYFNLYTEKDFKPIFNQYLLLTEIPVLELEKAEGGGTLLRYRWKASTEGFAMPISYSDDMGNSHWLFPNSTWQELDLGSLRIEDLHFHTDRFYIEFNKR
jgi:aminopeptidase N